jgi:polysaccharide export outer membrane protein
VPVRRLKKTWRRVRLGFVLISAASIGTGCAVLPGQGPRTGAVRSNFKDYVFVNVKSDLDIPQKDVTNLTPTWAPQEHPKRRYSDLIMTRDRLGILITDSSSQSPFYHPGGPYEYGPVEVPETEVLRIPYAGSVETQGHTPDTLAAVISKKVKNVSASAEVSVTRVWRLEKRAHVLGQVHTPGPVVIDRKNFSALDLLASTGGPVSKAHLYRFQLQRDGDIFDYDFKALQLSPFPVEDGDVLTVSKQQAKSFHAMGTTRRPGSFDFPSDETTLAQALSVTGGLGLHESDRRGIFVLRPGRGETPDIAYGLNLKNPETMFLASRFLMWGGDILYLSESPISEWRRLLNAVLPFGQVAQSSVSTAATVP